MPSNNNSWEIIQMSNRRGPTEAHSQKKNYYYPTTGFKPTTVLPASHHGGAHRPSIMVPVLRRGTGSHRLNNNRIFAVTSGHGGSRQASRRLPHQFVVTDLTIRRKSQNDPAAMSTYGRIRAACLPPPPAQNHPTPPPPPPPVNNAVVVNERVRSQEPAPSEEFATDDNGVTQPHINLPDNPMKNDVVEYEEPDLTLKL